MCRGCYLIDQRASAKKPARIKWLNQRRAAGLLLRFAHHIVSIAPRASVSRAAELAGD